MGKKVLYILLLFLMGLNISAQEKSKTIVYIEHSDEADYDDNLGKNVQRLIGNVVIRQDSSYYYSDSAYFYEDTKSFKGFSNVHVIMNDSVDMYGDRMEYNGNTRFLEMFDNVILKDDSTVLTTQYMTYDRVQHLASYPNHGVITRNDKKLVSLKGYYRDDLKEMYFRTDVVVTMPDYKMLTDTLVYNTDSEMMYFFGPSTIYNKKNTLFGNYGYYDANKEIVYLDKRATLANQEQTITSDTMLYEKSIGHAKAFSDVIMTDKTRKSLILGQYSEMWEKRGKGFVTDSLILINHEQKDSLYMHGDSLYFYFDTVTHQTTRFQVFYNVRFYRIDIQGKCDSLEYSVADSTVRMRHLPVLWTQGSQMTSDSINIVVNNNHIDSVLLHPNAFIIQQDSIEGYNQIKGKTIVAYFKDNELHHVFNDGNAETVYWLREEDGSSIGINFSKSVSMDIGVENNKIVRITYFKKTDEVLYPEDEVEESQRYLKSFQWQEELRPTDKNDIFRPKEEL